ncbi:MAG: hypothetical protein JKY49_07425 [Cohaesibacteraceae bacterium]|nr:hypothetical protein [Cohaesibacteraceae bacterium]
MKRNIEDHNVTKFSRSEPAYCSKNWRSQLEKNKGRIYSQSGEWLSPKIVPPSAFFDDDVWCDAGEEIRNPAYEQNFARFIESVVAAGYCGRSGSAKLDFVLQNLSLERARGDLFDPNKIYIDRESVPRKPEDERTICESFGIAGRRTFNRLKDRVDNPRKTMFVDRPCNGKLRGLTSQRPLLARLCWCSLARKVFLARIGYPEYCERFVY